MHSRHLSDELILSIDKSQLGKVQEFLSTLSVSEENEEEVECLREHKNHSDIFTITTNNNEKLNIVIGEKKIHIFLKKNDSFVQLQEKIPTYLKF